MMLCAKLYREFFTSRDQLSFNMDADLFSSTSAWPFDQFSFIYLHCIDISSQNTVEVTSFKCLQVSSVLGHFSLPQEQDIRRICCFFEESRMSKKAFKCAKPCFCSHHFKLPLHGKAYYQLENVTL